MRAACRTVLRTAREAVQALHGQSTVCAAPGPSPLDRHLLEAHRLAPLAGWLQDAAPSPPEPGATADALREALHRSKLRAMVQDKAGTQILDALRAADVPAMAFKGFDLGRRLYPEPGLRPFDDIDVLIQERDLAPAVHVAEGLGYRHPRGSMPLPLLRRFHFHVAMAHPTTGCLVELHWRLMESQGMPVRVDLLAGPDPARQSIDPPLYAAYLAAHAAKHGILNRAILQRGDDPEFLAHPWSGNRLIWFVDLALLCASAALSWPQVEAAARPLGLAVDARNTFLLLDRVLPGIAPGCVPPESCAPGGVSWIDRRLLRRIAADLDTGRDSVEPLPWYLRTNRLLHIRPVRLFHG